MSKGLPSGVEPMPDEPHQEFQGFDDMPDDALSKLIDGGYNKHDENEDAEAEDDQSVEPGVPDELLGESDEESESEESEDAKDDTESDEEAEKSEEAVQEKPITEADLLRLQLEQAKAQAEHFRAVHDKIAGKYGDLKQRYEKERGDTPRTTRSYDDVDEPARQTDIPPSIRKEIDDLNAYRRQQQLDHANHALVAEVEKFKSEHPDMGTEEVQTKLAKALESRADLVQQALESADADIVRRAARFALTDAYLEAKAAVIKEKMERASADSAASLKKRKLAGKLSSSGRKPAASAKKYRDQNDFLKNATEEELAAAVDSLSGL